MTDFVDGWILGHTLGEGAYGEVKLVINKATEEAVAMKMVDLSKHPDARRTVRKETTIHRMLSNPNIIQYFGQRSEKNMEYIFLEYASGGELFDKIEPDIGMPKWEAQKYFRQLISAVEYLHSRGVAHRDLKPENLLLDENDNLKVSDFGLATVYRLQGKERSLDTRCGTLPYVAPEVLERPYQAEPADIWSSGIILVALLAGELPWDQASAECPEYEAWKNGKYMSVTPWKKLDKFSLSLISQILVHEPSRRFKISEIKKHAWFRNNLSEEGNPVERDVVDGLRAKRLHIDEEEKLMRTCLSQPELPGIGINGLATFTIEERPGFSFSQPAHMEDLLLSTQLQTLAYTQTQTQTSQSTFQKMVRRMTRFFVKTACDTTVKRLISCLKTESYTYRINDCGIITISSMDRRKMPLVFKINIHEMDGKILVDFRLSKGCGLEFKRRFLKIKEKVDDIIARDSSNHRQSTFQKMVRRMTRFFVKTACDTTVKRLISCLKTESYTYRINDCGIITISSMDRRKMPLVFKINIHEMDGKILVDFRLSKGCGLEFKRRFLKIKEKVDDIIARDSSNHRQVS